MNIQPENNPEDTSDYITVTHGMSGYFAVHMWWNNEEDCGSFWEPWNTGIGRYGNISPAIEEGKDWAASEGIRFVEPKQ